MKELFMTRKFLPLILLALTMSCTLVSPKSLSFDDKVATQAAVVFTATALDQLIKSQTAIPQITAEISTSETPTPEPAEETDDPVKSLGQPNWKDDLSNAGNWFLGGEFITNNTKFTPSNGKISASSASTSDGMRWYLFYEKKPKNIYIEAKFDTDTCSGQDQYGIVFRAPNMDDGYANFFGVTCDGNFNLKQWNSSGLSVLVENTRAEGINTGAAQSNVLGVWAKDDRLRLYVNGQFLKEISNNSLLNDGHFGLFINAKSTPGFSVSLDEIAYWQID